LGLYVVPWWAVAVAVVELDHLRVAEMASVVVAAMAQIDAADEGDVVVGVVSPASDDELLMMAPASSHPLVEQELAPGSVDVLREGQVLLLREVQLRGMGAPQQTAHAHAARRELLEDPRQLGARTGEPFVGI